MLDACNLGTAATYFFKAEALTRQCGLVRPEYRRVAMGLCDFAVKAQTPRGEFAKSWFIDGSIDSPHGTIGSFFIPPLLDAYTLTGEETYKQAALKAFDFYYDEFMTGWFTTAGALDSFCIDKESAAPLIRSALRCYHATQDLKYARCRRRRRILSGDLAMALLHELPQGFHGKAAWIRYIRRHLGIRGA